MPSPDDSFHATAEGARYALLRRLAPDLPLVQDTAARLKDYSRAAVQSSLDLIEWLAPQAGAGRPLREAVRDTLDLLRGSLLFRGFTLRDEVQAAHDPVPGDRLRYLLPACLLWLTDSAGAPAEVTVRTHPAGEQLQLVLDLQPTEGERGGEDPPAYRPLREEEVQALARDEDITLERQGDTVSLTLARAA